jgi:hypothetical protein
MKTSTTLIIAAVCVILASLTIYNFSLKSSFLNGDYKNRFYGLKFTPIKNLKEVHVESGNKLSVQIEQGTKEGIWIEEKTNDFLKWTVSGNVLNINLNEKAKKDGNRISGENIIIISNKIDRVVTHPFFKDPEEEKNGYNSGEVVIKGFNQDKMALYLDKSTAVYLDKSKLNLLDADLADKLNGNSRLTIAAENTIKDAMFKIQGAGTLNLMDPTIIKTNYQLSDKATVTLNGKSLALFSQRTN